MPVNTHQHESTLCLSTHIHTPHLHKHDTHMHFICASGKKKNLNMLCFSIKIAFLLFLTMCHDTKISFFCIKMTMSGYPSVTVFHFLVTSAQAPGQGPAQPGLTTGMSSRPEMTWKDAQWELWRVQRELTVPELEEAQRGGDMKGKSEEKIPSGPLCSPLSQSSRSGDAGTTSCFYQFPFA